MTKVCVCGEFVEKTTSNSIKSVQNGKTSSGDICTRFRKAEGLPWQSSGYDSMLPKQGVWVQSLVRELRSRTLQLTPAAAKQTLLIAEK